MKRLSAILLLMLIFVFRAKAQDSLKYSKAQILSDINFFIANAEEIHPNLYHAITKVKLTYKIDSLAKSLPDSLSLLNSYYALEQATAFINEGHTGLNIPRLFYAQINMGKFQSIPFQLEGEGDGFLAGKLMLPNGNLNNVRISSINGKKSTDIWRQLMTLKGGLPSFRKVLVINNFRFYLMAIGIKAPYLIEYVAADGSKIKANLNTISESEYRTAIAKAADKQNYTFNVMDGKYGYMNFKNMYEYNNFTNFCDSVFHVIRDQHIDKLVVDLRENSGGNSQLGWFLLNYITDKPFRMAGESERKISQQFKDLIISNKKLYGESYDHYLARQNGSFLKMGNVDLYKPDDKDYKYKGKVCFLIGPTTFSSANMLSATVKDFKLATLIGEATGEPANDYGELCNIKLPQTGLLGYTSTTMWVRPNNNKTDKNPIYPDYCVKASTSGKDNVLQFAFKWLDK